MRFWPPNVINYSFMPRSICCSSKFCVDFKLWVRFEIFRRNGDLFMNSGSARELLSPNAVNWHRTGTRYPSQHTRLPSKDLVFFNTKCVPKQSIREISYWAHWILRQSCTIVFETHAQHRSSMGHRPNISSDLRKTSIKMWNIARVRANYSFVYVAVYLQAELHTNMMKNYRCLQMNFWFSCS